MMSLKIGSSKCTGCGACVNACPRSAITVHDNLAIIHENLCVQCGTCVEVCPAGAIREIVPAHTKPAKRGERVMYGYGRGFGFRGRSPLWPYVGHGRGGLPHHRHHGLLGGAASCCSAQTRDEELGFLRGQANVMRHHLEDIELRIQELEEKD